MGHMRPNPTFGKMSVATRLHTLVVALTVLPFAAGRAMLGRFIWKNGLTVKDDLKRAIIRSALAHMPTAALRQSGGKRIDKILSSCRFISSRHNLMEQVHRDDFSGYWICQGKINNKQDPSKSDLVLLFCHGGGYVIGDIAMCLSLLLGIAEFLNKQGLTVSILALDYCLAPEQPFPKQIQQARAAYKYLTTEVGVHASKVGVLGDSAGGNLAMGLFTSIQVPLPGETPSMELTKPKLGLFMLSPWVCPGDMHVSWLEKSSKDVVTKSGLEAWATYFKSGSGYDPETISFYTDFSRPILTRPSWSKIFPATVFLTAGGDELFETDIANLASSIRADGIDVSLEISSGQIHDWQLSEHNEHEDAWLKIDQSGDTQNLMTGAKQVAVAIAEAATRASNR